MISLIVLKDLKMQALLPYFVRKAKRYYNAQFLDYWKGKNKNLLFWSSGHKPYYIIIFMNFPFTVNNNTKYQHLQSLQALSYKIDITPFYKYGKTKVPRSNLSKVI